MSFDGLLNGLSSPMGSLGLGLLANSRDQYGNFAPFGDALAGGMNTVYKQQLANQLIQEKQKAAQQEQAQKQWLQQNMPGMVNAPSMVQQEAIKARYAQPKETSLMQNLVAAGLKPGTPEFQQAMMQAVNKPATSVEVNTAPKLPAGYMWIDAGNPSKGVQPLPGSKQDREEADAQGQVLNSADVAQDGINLLNQMLQHPGLDYAVGTSSMLPIVPGTPAADFDALAKQMEGKAFLQAFESLKGGGQITQIEGEKATAAMARLQRAQSEKEYKASLRELRNIYQRALSRSKSRMRQSVQQSSGGWTVEESQ